MSAQTLLFDFSIDPIRINGDTECKLVIKSVIQCLNKYFKAPSLLFETSTTDGFLALYKDEKTIISIRLFIQGLITLNIEYYKIEGELQKLNFEVSTIGNAMEMQYFSFFLKIAI